MLILVTNDDGIHSPGIQVLAQRLACLGRIIVVAPDRERSAVGHALTLHRPLRAEEIKPDFISIDGTPTDCVNLGIHGLLDRQPDLVISGINRGGNLGDDITYSGTVAAAMEATLMGVPAFAVSLSSKRFLSEDFYPAADFAVQLAQQVMSEGLPPDTLLNVNLPAGNPAGVMVTRQGKRVYEETVEKKIDPRGRTYYWIGGGDPGFQDEEGTDFYALQHGKISVTPLHLDLTNYNSVQDICGWNMDRWPLSGSDRK